jgi:hypothetical protein
MKNQTFKADYAIADKITELLIDRTNSVLKPVAVTGMKKADQVATFGRYFGKGTLLINPLKETVTHSVKVAFGCDSAWTAQIKFDGALVFDNRALRS